MGQFDSPDYNRLNAGSCVGSWMCVSSQLAESSQRTPWKAAAGGRRQEQVAAIIGGFGEGQVGNGPKRSAPLKCQCPLSTGLTAQ